MKMTELLDKLLRRNYTLSDEEILHLLTIENTCREFYELLSISNTISREKFGNRGYVFSQIGINAQPCSENCKFCSFGTNHYSTDNCWIKTLDDLKSEVNFLQTSYFDDLFLMSTADYPIERFLSYSYNLRSLLKPGQRFVANIGDFDFEIAKELKTIGFTGVYHVNRLKEGVDTLINPVRREATLDAALKAGLELYYCIEPIGPEHTYEELLIEIKRAEKMKIKAMAVMRRIPVPGTPLYEKGEISALELTKIAAVTNLVVNPSRSMNVHEPIQMALLAGVNQFYAESGSNPRDTNSETQLNRGFTPLMAWKMLAEGGYYPVNYS